MKRPRDAALRDAVRRQQCDRPACKGDGAAVGTQRAGNDIEDGGFAGSIGADQAEDFAAAERKARLVDGEQAAKGLAHIRELQDRRVAHGVVLRRTRPYKSGYGLCQRRHRDMWQLRLQKADHAVRQAIDDQHENGAQDDAEIVRKRRDQHFEQQDQRHGAEQRTEQRAGAAEQRHDHDLEGEHRVERDRRVDIGPARRHHRPGHGHEGGAHREQNELGAGRVDAAVAGDRLVLADDADGKAEPGVADQPAGDQYHDDERQQAASRCLPSGVGEDVAPDRAVDVDFVPGDQLADELGQAEAEDHEIDSRQAQRRQADDQRHDDADNSCRNEHHRPRQKIGEDRGRIGADAEEGCRRERDVMGRTRRRAPRRSPAP